MENANLAAEYGLQYNMLYVVPCHIQDIVLAWGLQVSSIALWQFGLRESTHTELGDRQPIPILPKRD